MFGNITQVGPGTAKTFEDLKSGFQFRVVGDGQVESEILDRFASAEVLTGLDDARIKAFSVGQLALAARQLPESETRTQLEASLKEQLGEQWKISTYRPQAGGGVARVDIEYVQPGAGSQKLYLDNRDLACSLTTSFDKGGWTVEHKIEGRQDQSGYLESATFSR